MAVVVIAIVALVLARAASAIVLIASISCKHIAPFAFSRQITISLALLTGQKSAASLWARRFCHINLLAGSGNLS
jgi:hypothetical protein